MDIFSVPSLEKGYVYGNFYTKTSSSLIQFSLIVRSVNSGVTYRIPFQTGSYAVYPVSLPVGSYTIDSDVSVHLGKEYKTVKILDERGLFVIPQTFVVKSGTATYLGDFIGSGTVSPLNYGSVTPYNYGTYYLTARLERYVYNPDRTTEKLMVQYPEFSFLKIKTEPLLISAQKLPVAWSL